MADIAAPDLNYAFGLPPEQAIRYFEGLGNKITWDWRAAADAIRNQQFTVAGAARLDILKDIRQGLLDALKEGTTERTFQQTLLPILQDKGWVARDLAGEIDFKDPKALTRASQRLSTIYRTNLQSAYMAGRYRDLMRVTRSRPYWMYVAVLDSKTRPTHRALNGRIFHYTDAIWSTHFPPNGYNCRCRVRALSERDLKRLGLEVSNSADALEEIDQSYGVDRVTGEVITRPATAWKGIGLDGRPIRFAPDPGFGFIPGASEPMLLSIGDKALAALGDAANPELVKLGTSPDLIQAFRNFVRDTKESGLTRGTHGVLGYLQLQEHAFAAAKGAAPKTLAVVLEDRLVVGKKSLRTTDAGRALTEEELLDLPMLFAQAEMKLWSPEDGKLVYVLPSYDDRKIKIVVRLDSTPKGSKEIANLVRSVHKARLVDLQGNIKQGLLEEIGVEN